MKVSDIGKLVRSRGGIVEHPVRVFHGNNLIWERLNESPVETPSGVLRARYDATISESLQSSNTLVSSWETAQTVNTERDMSLIQTATNRQPKLSTLNGLQAIKFAGEDRHAGTPKFTDGQQETNRFKSEYMGDGITLPGDVEAGLFVRYFWWRNHYYPGYDATLAVGPDVVYYAHATSDYWMVNATRTTGFNRVGTASPPNNQDWTPVQLSTGTHETLYKLPEKWVSARIPAWTNQAPDSDKYYLENRGWYFSSGVLVNAREEDYMSSGSPLQSAPGQETLLDGMTVAIVFRSDDDPDPFGIQSEHYTAESNESNLLDMSIDGRGSLWFHKHPHINTHAPWEGQLYFDYRRDGIDSRIQSGNPDAADYADQVSEPYQRYIEMTPNRPKVLVYQLDTIKNKMQVYFDGKLYIEGDINGDSQKLTINSSAGFILAWAGFAQAVTIGEVLVFDNKLDSQTRMISEGYLAHKWGIDDKLPSWHLHKSVSPSQQLLESSWTKE